MEDCVKYLLHNLYISFGGSFHSFFRILPEKGAIMKPQPVAKPFTPTRRVSGQVRLRGFIALSMIALWMIVGLTGFLLEFAPSGQRSGHLAIFLLTKTQWGDIHFWMSIAAGALTIIHLMVDWKALKACARYLISGVRGNGPCE
jgi:hypothetical protein